MQVLQFLDQPIDEEGIRKSLSPRQDTCSSDIIFDSYINTELRFAVYVHIYIHINIHYIKEREMNGDLGVADDNDRT